MASKNCPASKAPYTRPTIAPIFQVDFPVSGKAGDMDTKIHKFGCCFLTTMAIPQFVNNKTLTMDQIRQVYQVALSKNWIDANCSVWEPGKIINYVAETMLGDYSHTYTMVMQISNSTEYDTWGVSAHKASSKVPNNQNVYFFVTDFYTTSGPEYGGHHFELFSGIGSFLFDPANGTIGGYKGVAKMRGWKVSLKKSS